MINRSPDKRVVAETAGGQQHVQQFFRYRPGETERKIVQMAAAGKSNKEIAGALGPTKGTVKIHVGHILKRLGVVGRAEAIRMALERGIVHLNAG